MRTCLTSILNAEIDILDERENEDINRLARMHGIVGGARARGGKAYQVGVNRNTISYTGHFRCGAIFGASSIF